MQVVLLPFFSKLKIKKQKEIKSNKLSLSERKGQGEGLFSKERTCVTKVREGLKISRSVRKNYMDDFTFTFFHVKFILQKF